MTAHAKVRVSNYLVGVVESKVRLAESALVEAGEWVDHWGVVRSGAELRRVSSGLVTACNSLRAVLVELQSLKSPLGIEGNT